MQQQEIALSERAMLNLEALARGESPPGGCENPPGGNHCPCITTYVPNRFMISEIVTAEKRSDRYGYITLGGRARGGFTHNTFYSVTVSHRNCLGKAPGACCNQNNIGFQWP